MIHNHTFLRLKKSVKKILCLAIFAVIIFAGERAVYHVTGDFCLSNITYDLPNSSEWNITLTPTEKERIDSILNQRFYFIGKGNQTYTFESQDGKSVIKFFKFGHLKPSWFQQGINASQKKRLEKIFAGYMLAYERDRDNSGMIYIHFNRNHEFQRTITAFDWFGIAHEINLDQVVFVLQEKMIPTKTILVEALEKGDIETAKKRISQLFDLYIAEYHKGIYDRNHDVICNTGYIGNKAIRLDLGKIRMDERMKNHDIYIADLRKVAFDRIDKWMHKYYPQYENEIDDFMKKKLSIL